MLALAVVLLALLLADVFFTVFDGEGRGGPLNRVQNRLIWRLFRVAAGESRAVLALAAPLMAVATLALWVAILVAAFAIAYYPFIDSFLVSPGQARSAWSESIYYSGYTAATLGFGDIVPDLPWLRILAPLEAFLGFALLSVSVTYLLAVYRELLGVQTLAVSLDVYFKTGLPAHLDAAEIDAQAARFLESSSLALLHALGAHFQYPVLHYFRPRESARSLVVQLGPVIPHVRERKRVQVSKGLSYDAFLEAVERYLMLVENHFIPRGFAPDPDGLPDGATEVDRAYARLLRFMRYDRV